MFSKVSRLSKVSNIHASDVKNRRSDNRRNGPNIPSFCCNKMIQRNFTSSETPSSLSLIRTSQLECFNLLSSKHFHLNPEAEGNLFLFCSITENTGKHSEQSLGCLMLLFWSTPQPFFILSIPSSQQQLQQKLNQFIKRLRKPIMVIFSPP